MREKPGCGGASDPRRLIIEIYANSRRSSISEDSATAASVFYPGTSLFEQLRPSGSNEPIGAVIRGDLVV